MDRLVQKWGWQGKCNKRIKKHDFEHSDKKSDWSNVPHYLEKKLILGREAAGQGPRVWSTSEPPCTAKQSLL